MTYMNFEKEYIKDRPTEPYSENEDASDWANLTRYAEDNLQKAFNLGYCECYHISTDIIKNLVDCIRFLNSNRNNELTDVNEFLKNAEKFIEVGKMKYKDCSVPPIYDYQENCKLCGLFGWDNDDKHFKVYADGEDGCIHRKATIEKWYKEENGKIEEWW